MAENVQIELTQKSRDLIEAFRGAPEVLAKGIRKGLDRGALGAISRVQRQRFTGKGPFPVSQRRLGVRSGLLRRSLGTLPAEIEKADTLEVSAEAGPVGDRVGSIRKYFAAHEFGSRRVVTVAAHTRSRGSNSHPVRAHTRRMNVPERAPFRTGLRERKTLELFADAIEQAIVDEIESMT